MEKQPIDSTPNDAPLGDDAAAQVVRFFMESLLILITNAADGPAIDYLKMCREHVLQTWPESLREKGILILDTLIK